MLDQPFWAERAYELGVSPKPIPAGQLSVDRVAKAIDTSRPIAPCDGALRRSAYTFAARMVSDAAFSFSNSMSHASGRAT